MPLGSGQPIQTRSANLAALIGDSRAKNFYNATYGAKNAQNPLVWAMGYMQQRLRVVYNGGISGDRSDQWQLAASPAPGYTTMNNVTAMVSTSALWAIFAGIAVNDFSGGFTADQVWVGYNGAPGLRATLNLVRAAGMRAVVFAETGATSFSATQIGYVHKLNRYLRGWVEANPGAIYFDEGAVVWSPTVTSTLAFKSGYSGDGTHLIAKGAEAAGSALATLLSPHIPLFDERMSCGNESSTQGGVQFAANPLFLTGTGGTLNTGMTGTAPSGLTISRDVGTPTGVVSVISDPNGYGNAVQIAATFGAANDAIKIDMSLGASGWTTGDIYFGQMRVEVANGSSNASPPYLRLGFYYNGFALSFEVFDLFNSSSYGAGPTTAYNLDLKTDRLTIPAYTTADLLLLRLRLAGTAAGSQTVTISRESITKAIN